MQPALWKRAVAEFFGLFLLASIGLMTVATAITTSAYGLFELSIAFALVIMVILLVVAAVSGGHINPAITIALAAYKRFPWREVPVYVAAQVAGGFTGASFLYLLYARPIRALEEAQGIVRGEPGSELTAMIFHDFAPNPAIAGALGWDMWFIGTPTALLAEVFGTFVLALVIFAVLDPRNSFAPSLGSFALILGLVVGFVIMVAAPISMAGINPARDLGPRLAAFALGWGAVSIPGTGPDWWVWTVGPIVGALLGGAAAIGLGGMLGRPPVAEAAGTEAEALGAATPAGDPTTTTASSDATTAQSPPTQTPSGA